MGFNLIVAICRTNSKNDIKFISELGIGIGGIGYKGDLPWPRINKDMNIFKTSTTSFDEKDGIKNVVIMGRKTWDSLPKNYKPLSDRINVIISRTLKTEDLGYENCYVYDNLNEALEIYKDEDYNTWVIGGSSLYNEAIKHEDCNFVFVTKIFNRYLCDTYFGGEDGCQELYQEVYRSNNLYQDEVKFKFCVYKRDNFEIKNSHKTWLNYIFKDYKNEIEVDNNYGNNLAANCFEFNMEHPENQYLNLIKDIMRNGRKRMDRTGTGTYSVFGRQLRFDIREYFPILTTKRVYWKGVVEELLWFLKGDTNINHLIEKNVHIWDGNSTREYLDKIGLVNREERDGGPIYGFQWRHFGAKYNTMYDNYEGCGVDQFAECLNLIRNNPESRRIIMSAWNPSSMKEMCLPPCHVMYQFYVDVENNEISCHMYQRSADVFLGLPFNICSTALLTHIMASLTDRKVGDIIISLGDAHIYSNHLEQCKIQIERIPRDWPILKINGCGLCGWSEGINNVEDFKFENFELLGYSPHPTIKAEMAV